MFEKKKSQFFAVSGISEHTNPNNKGYKKYPNKLVQVHSQLLGDFGEKSQGPNKKVFVGICVFVCVCVCMCYYIQIPLYKVIKFFISGIKNSVKMGKSFHVTYIS